VSRHAYAGLWNLGGTSLALASMLGTAWAQDAPSPAPSTTLPAVTVTAPATTPQVPAVSDNIKRYALPQTVESVDRQQIDDTTNIVDTEDAVKYLPSIFIRKRNYGDTQPTIQTRTAGINASASTLVYVDDTLISALLSNNNTTGAPRWGMVAPEQIKGIDMLYGPFAAEYPGNSKGGVLLITTRQPDSLEATAKQTEAFQHFNMYKTDGSYSTSNSALTAGDRIGKTSFFVSANREESFSQPLQFITSASTPSGTTGQINSLSKTGTVANVVGAGGLLHTTMDNFTLRTVVDVNDWLKATWAIGYWDNVAFSTAQTYLTSGGNLTFGGVSGFASNTYNLAEQHLMNALSLKTDTGGKWDWEIVATRYDYLNDIQRGPAGVTTGTNFTTNGLITRLDGTGWSTQDGKLIWRPAGTDGAHEMSFGAHHDLYTLANPTYQTTNWLNPSTVGTGALSTYGSGNTETYAFWAQEAWKFGNGFKLTLGARGELWRAFGGYNYSTNAAGTVAAFQPNLQASNISPKATLSWQVDSNWSTKLSFGQAYRYPTVSELYQIVSTGSTYAIPNPNLSPESVLSFEWAIERQDKNSRLRLSLFEEDTSNALIQQTQLINNTYTSTWQNVGLTRNRGFELVGELKDFLIPGLTLSNSVTYVDSVIVSDPGFQSATGSIATGQRVPYIPDWRDTIQAIYRPTDDLAFAASARYQGKMYSTLDNSDSVPYVMGAFDNFFVVDLHARYQIVKAVDAEFGIDNLTDDKYFEYHPFPGRTFIAALKVKL
jgi:iron complex outermembrane receptor protein